jgi:type I restriction enzyme S subunit
MGKYNAYQQYKDSGVEWLGDIPEHWEVKRFKFILKDGYEGLKIGPFGSQIKSEKLSALGNYKIYGQENVINQDFLSGYRYLEDELFKELSIYEIKPNDLLITMMGTSGRCYIVPSNIQKGIMDSHLIRLRLAKGYHLRFTRYLIDESEYVHYQIKTKGKGSIMHGLNSSIIKSLVLMIPPLHEQKIIAQFLDYKTQQIDQLIAKKEALLERLDEKRTALISHAVTKGLDPNIPMKDSGIEWLGDIPKHWEVSRPKYLCSRIVDGTHKTPEYIDFGVPFLTVKNLTVNHGISFKELKYISFESHQELCKRANPQKGDILITKDGTLGVTRVVETKTEFSIFVSLALLKPYNLKINSYYFRDVLESKAVSAQFEARKEGSALKHIHLIELANIFLPLPPLLEQKNIMTFTKNKTQQIDQQKAKIKQAIELLKEYRTALITNAVTGKIDVRQVPIPQLQNNHETN